MCSVYYLSLNTACRKTTGFILFMKHPGREDIILSQGAFFIFRSPVPVRNIFQIRGIGNLTTERPQLYEWDQMKLKPGMRLNLQPRYTDGSGTAIILDTYLVTEKGDPRRFSCVPQELIRL